MSLKQDVIVDLTDFADDDIRNLALRIIKYVDAALAESSVEMSDAALFAGKRLAGSLLATVNLEIVRPVLLDAPHLLPPELAAALSSKG